jgi:excisionase family DNA binding protein
MDQFANVEEKVLTVKQASDACNLSEKTVRRLVDRGILDRTGPGVRLVLITESSINRWKRTPVAK